MSDSAWAAIKEKLGVITAGFSVVSTVVGGFLWMEHNFASAADLGVVIRNQDRQIQMIEQTQRQSSMFQLEYYDDRIRKLQVEKQQAEEVQRSRSQARGLFRSPDQIQSDIDDLKQRRELVRRSLEEPTRR